MFGISLTEMLAIIVIAVIVIKPEDWPKVARFLGRGVRFFRQTSAEARAVLSQGLAEPVQTPVASVSPIQKPPASGDLAHAGGPSAATAGKNGDAHV